MTSAFEAFVHEIVDYAGLFPPARLDMTTAVGNYARFREEEHAWMMGRFIVPAARLDEFQGDVPRQLCVLLESAEAEEEAVMIVRNELEAVREFSSAHDGATVEGFEILFPGETVAAATPDRWASFLAVVEKAMEDAGFEGVDLFAEVPATDNWSSTDASAIEGLEELREKLGDSRVLSRTGFKLRCGGVDPEAFPSVERVTGIIAECRDRRVPLKFTAGLHHPMRQHDSDIEIDQHGFLNVFVAGVMAWCIDLDPKDIRACLYERDASSFRFIGEQLYWRDNDVTQAQVERARVAFVTAFGSCSFDEPVDDLKILGLLTDERTK